MNKVTVGYIDFDGISTTEIIECAGTAVVRASWYFYEPLKPKPKPIKKKVLPVVKQEKLKPGRGYKQRIKQVKKP